MIWKSLLITFTNETIQQQWSFLLPPSLSPPPPPLLILPSHRFKVRCFVWIWICDDVWRRYQDGSVEQIDNIYYVYNLLVSKEWKINFRNIKSTKIAKRMVAITAVVALSIIIPSACLLLLLPCRYLRQQHPPSVSPHSPTSFFLTGITVPCDEHEMYFILWLKSSSTTTMSW